MLPTYNQIEANSTYLTSAYLYRVFVVVAILSLESAQVFLGHRNFLVAAIAIVCLLRCFAFNNS